MKKRVLFLAAVLLLSIVLSAFAEETSDPAEGETITVTYNCGACDGCAWVPTKDILEKDENGKAKLGAFPIGPSTSTAYVDKWVIIHDDAEETEFFPDTELSGNIELTAKWERPENGNKTLVFNTNKCYKLTTDEEDVGAKIIERSDESENNFVMEEITCPAGIHTIKDPLYLPLGGYQRLLPDPMIDGEEAAVGPEAHALSENESEDADSEDSDDYVFAGLWFTGNGALLASGNYEITSDMADAAGQIDLYPVFAAEISFYVKYMIGAEIIDPDTGEVWSDLDWSDLINFPEDYEITDEMTKAVRPADPKMKGYDFVEWCREAEEDSWDYFEEYEYEDEGAAVGGIDYYIAYDFENEVLPKDGDLWLYAIWTWRGDDEPDDRPTFFCLGDDCGGIPPLPATGFPTDN